MEEPEQQDQSTQGNQGGRRSVARKVFPRVPLEAALELARTVFGEGEGEPVRRLTVFNRLQRSPESGPSRTLVTASATGYGLTTGGTQSEYLSLTDRGKRIVDSVDEMERMSAVYDALFSNTIFSALAQRFKEKTVPNDEVAVDYLRGNHALNGADAKAFWDIAKKNIADFGLVQELSGRRVLVSRGMALERLQATLPQDQMEVKSNGARGGTPNPSTGSVPIHQGLSVAPSRLEPQIHFNIQIHLPENATPEVYDAIFRSIGSYLLSSGS